MLSIVSMAKVATWDLQKKICPVTGLKLIISSYVSAMEVCNFYFYRKPILSYLVALQG